MPIEPNPESRCLAIIDKIDSERNQIRDLIGSTHWGTEGGHKELVVRKALRQYVPESYPISGGFIIDTETDSNSGQIDVLISDPNVSPLYNLGDVRIVPRRAVKVIMEVKTGLGDRAKRKSALNKLADDIAFARQSNQALDCKAGLYIFDDVGGKYDEGILELLQEVVNGKPERVINYIAYGKKWFVKYWEDPSKEDDYCPVEHNAWHTYKIGKFVPWYLLGNVIAFLDNTPLEEQRSWFPIKGDGKVDFRKHTIGIVGSTIHSFR